MVTFELVLLILGALAAFYALASAIGVARAVRSVPVLADTAAPAPARAHLRLVEGLDLAGGPDVPPALRRDALRADPDRGRVGDHGRGRRRPDARGSDRALQLPP